MRQRIKTPAAALAACALAACFLAACSTQAGAATAAAASQTQSQSAAASQPAAEAKDEDLDASVDEAKASNITLDGKTAGVTGSGASAVGGTVTITAAGTYIVSGALADGQIVVDAPDDALVRLVLDGADISCAASAPVWCKNADKLVIVLADGSENTLADGGGRASEEDPAAALFSACDLTINGTGSLSVTGNHDKGVNTKDDLLVVGGNISVNAVGHAVRGHDSVTVLGGTIALTSGGDGLHSDNTDKEGKANIAISGGDITINAGDDGIHADNALTITGGVIDIRQSYEGLEGKTITVTGGDISVVSSDDAINATSGTTTDGGIMFGGENAAQTGVYLRIDGGKITLDAGGDGLDSNGDIHMAGGEVYVSGPTSNGDGAIDYNGAFTISGGVLVAAGSSGMAEAPGGASEQASLLLYFSSAQKAGSALALKDANGNTLAGYTPTKAYQSAVFSAPGMAAGETYAVYVDGAKTAEVTLTGAANSFSDTGEAVSGGMGGMGGVHGGRENGGTPPADMPSGEPPAMPPGGMPGEPGSTAQAQL